MEFISEKQLFLPGGEFIPPPAVVSASRRTELVALRPDWLTGALQRFPGRFKRDIHSVVLWTKDPSNIYRHQGLSEELKKYNLLVELTVTGLGGTRIEPTVPYARELVQNLPKLLDYLGDPRRIRWRFDPIVTMLGEEGSIWSSAVYFEDLANKMTEFGIDNCYFSFKQIYQRKFTRRKLKEAGVNLVVPELSEQVAVVDNMLEIATKLGIKLFPCAQPLLENISGVTAAKCIDAELLTELHPQKLPVSYKRDVIQSKYRNACYCTESIDIGSYLACGHGCVYCYAEAAVPAPDKLKLMFNPADLLEL